MPLGDSNTRGKDWDPAGYRDNLWNQLKSSGFDVDFVGSQKEGPSTIDRDHEGHGGWRIDEIANNVDSWLTSYQPDVIMLMIGTNDVLQDYQLSTAIDRLNNLIDKIVAKVPNAYLLVGSIPPIDRPLDQQQVLEYNAQIPGLVSSKASQGKKVKFVDIFKELTFSDLSSDDIHPTASGYAKIADVWYDALLPLPVLSNPSPSPSPSPSPTPNVIRLEAEAMQLTNYVIESNQSPASGSKIISLYQGGGTTGSATGTFNGPTGTYNVVVGYFDETDGKSQLTVKVGGVTDTWTFDKWLTDSWVTSKTKATRTVAQGVTLQAGSTIQLSGVADGGEWARVDYIDFIPVSSSPSPSPTPAPTPT
ncbi:GDSL-type esterase/lipase family protein, partial [Oculatella sp. LEGE 06141]